MKTVSIVTRSLDKNSANYAFRHVRPDLVRDVPVRRNAHYQLISDNPLIAGIEFHTLLNRMADAAPLSSKEKAYLPWMNALRSTIWGLGASEMEIESHLNALGVVPSGVCDLLVHGGPQQRGVVEVKVIAHGTQDEPRSRDLAQLGAYARLAAGHGSFDELWAAVAYIELHSGLVRLYGFKNSRQLVMHTIELLRAA